MTSLDLDTAGIKKILVCQQHQIGDVLLTTPALELLRKRFPEAEIHLYTEKKCVPVLDNNPHIDRIWAIDKQKLHNLFKEIQYYLKIAAENYDLVIDFQQLPRCRWVVAFSRAKYRLSYVTAWYKRPLYNLQVQPSPGYVAQEKVSLLAPLGITWSGEIPKLYLREEERIEIRERLEAAGLAAHDRLITVDPTHNRRTRRWPAEYYAQLMDLVVEHDPSFKFLVLHGPGEKEYAAKVAERFEHRDNLIDLPLRLTLREMFSLVDRADFHLGNCSAPRHCALALGTPSLTIRGASGSDWTYPSFQHQCLSANLPCQPCSKTTCDLDAKCLTELKPETVFITLREMLPPPVVPLE